MDATTTTRTGRTRPKTIARGLFGLAVAWAAIFATSCWRSDPPRYYLLSAVASPASSTAARGLNLGVGPVRFAEYLEQPAIMRRENDARLAPWTDRHWAQPLESNFANVVADNLAVLLATDRVAVFPWNARFSPDVIIGVRVAQFDIDSSATVNLRVTWTIERPNAALEIRRGHFRQQSDGGEPEDVVAAMSSAVNDFCTAVAQSLTAR